jgi:hypothetical protein
MKRYTDGQTVNTAGHNVNVEPWPAPMLIDAHTHLYDCFDYINYFDSTLANISRAKDQLALSHQIDTTAHTPACLLLAEPENHYAFKSVLELKELDSGRWKFIPCDDGLSLIAQLDGRDELILIEGRQIKTSENLEVLSLCSDKEIPDGHPTAWTLEKAIELGGLPVLPLGVGKWLGSRGRVIDDILRSPLADQLCLGDNAGRLAMGLTPRHFNDAQQRDIWILPGSGALPFKSQATRVGRYGLVLQGAVDRRSPAASIKHLIQAGGKQPVTFGRPDGPINFLKLQTAMQIRNRLCKS